jgi:hypothetical protein
MADPLHAPIGHAIASWWNDVARRQWADIRSVPDLRHQAFRELRDGIIGRIRADMPDARWADLAATNGDLGLALTEALAAGDRIAEHLRRVRDAAGSFLVNPDGSEAAWLSKALEEAFEPLEAWERTSQSDKRGVAPTSVGGASE